MVDENEFIIKPDLNVVKKAYLIGFFTIFILLLILGGLFVIDIMFLKWNFFSTIFFIPVVLLSFAFVFQPIYSIFKYLHFKESKYIFYPDRFEYFEGFFNQVRRVVQYKYVTDINLEKSWLVDKIYGTGSLSIFSAGIGTFGLKIRYIKNPNEVLEYLQKSIENYRK